MTVNVFQPFETGLPSDDEMIERLQQQNELLGQAIMPLYAGLGPQLDDQQDAIDLARRRLAERVKLQQKKTAKILEPVTGQLHDYATSALGEQQGMIDMSAARAGAAAATAGVKYAGSPLPALVPTIQPQGPITSPASPVPINFYGDSWLSLFRCSDGSSGAAKVGDDTTINSLLGSGYVLTGSGPWPDIYAATGWFQTTAGVDWIKANCGSVYIPPPIGPPPPPEGPPPPPDPTQGQWGAYLLCVNGTVAWAPLDPAVGLPTDPQFVPYQVITSLHFKDGSEAMQFLQSHSPADYMPVGYKCGSIISTLPPGCCAPWDLTPYIDKLCKCIKEAGGSGKSDLSDPLVFLFDERGEDWQQAARAWYGSSLDDLFEADTLDVLRGMRELAEGK